jgi:hypothetical protein
MNIETAFWELGELVNGQESPLYFGSFGTTPVVVAPYWDNGAINGTVITLGTAKYRVVQPVNAVLEKGAAFFGGLHTYGENA